MTNRFDRPGLFWTVTRDNSELANFVAMRVTKVTMERYYGGFNGVGCYRKISDCYGRFPTFTLAGQAASRMQFEVIICRQRQAQVRDYIKLAEEQLAKYERECQEALDAIKRELPQVALMDDPYSRH